MTVLEYLTSEYNRTKWPFFFLVEITNRFGQHGRDELNRLFADGKVRKREGIKGILVELL